MSRCVTAVLSLLLALLATPAIACCGGATDGPAACVEPEAAAAPQDSSHHALGSKSENRPMPCGAATCPCGQSCTCGDSCACAPVGAPAALPPGQVRSADHRVSEPLPNPESPGDPRDTDLQSGMLSRASAGAPWAGRRSLVNEVSLARVCVRTT
jgi:hypothetical protein